MLNEKDEKIPFTNTLLQRAEVLFCKLFINTFIYVSEEAKALIQHESSPLEETCFQACRIMKF